ncbi:MAG: hypothetical protein RLZZ28_1544 [Bacteroidota bacterium]|jgi:hypothetical protein
MAPQTPAQPNLFIDMAVHKKSWIVHLKTGLFDYKTVTMPAAPARLFNYVFSHFPNHEIWRSVYEVAIFLKKFIF